MRVVMALAARSGRRVGVLLTAALLSWPAGALAEQAKRPPNFLIVIADDLGWRDVGWHGSEIQTPHLDRLAQAGVRLERHYVYPTCSPTRAGLLTGRNPSRFRIHGPISDRSRESLPPDTRTLARALQDRGYTTALFGKWHLGQRPAVGPRRFGFDQTYGYLAGQIDPYTHLYKNGDRTWHRNDALIEEKGHATDLIAAEAVHFLAAKRTKPFLLWVAFSVPHHPLVEEQKWLAPYQDLIKDPSRRLYAASISHMDAAIGRILEALEKSGQSRHTMILFTSDNGGQRDYSSRTEYSGKYGPYATLGDNRPWHGWKGELYEGGIRVPACACWPGQLKPAILRESISFLDWLPTCARLAGARVEADWKIDGRDVWPVLLGEERKPSVQPVYWNVGSTAAVVVGDWKLIESQRKAGPVELYNLTDDPAERKNRAEEEPARVTELRKVLAEQRSLDP